MDRRERIRRYGLWPTIWRRLLQLQRPVVGFQRFHCLALLASDLRPAHSSGLEVRRLDYQELEPLVSMPDSEMTAHGFAAARRENHVCIGVFEHGRLASYSFNSTGRARFTDHLRVAVGDGWLYHYMAVTFPQWRGRRLHAAQMPFLLDMVRGQGGKGIVTLVDSVNYASLRSFRRMGFQECGVFTFLGAGRRQRRISGTCAAGFAFEKNA